jgi:hypothetical protein
MDCCAAFEQRNVGGAPARCLVPQMSSGILLGIIARACVNMSTGTQLGRSLRLFESLRPCKSEERKTAGAHVHFADCLCKHGALILLGIRVNIM